MTGVQTCALPILLILFVLEAMANIDKIRSCPCANVSRQILCDNCDHWLHVTCTIPEKLQKYFAQTDVLFFCNTCVSGPNGQYHYKHALAR